jgi:Ferritin-like domain
VLTTTPFSRSRLVRLALGGGAAFIAGVAAAPTSARVTASPTEEELATVRLLASGELLAQAFYANALSSMKLSKAEAADFEVVLAHERNHFRALATLLADSAPLAADFQFTFPREAFGQRGRMLRLGSAIERTMAGTYVAAAGSSSSPELWPLLARIAVSEAQHVALIDHVRGGRPAGVPFPQLFDVEQASAALAPFFGD